MSYEARRLENIQRNQALVQDLGLENDLVAVQHDLATTTTRGSPSKSHSTGERRVAKRRKVETAQPTRTSTRIANAPTRPLYSEDATTAATVASHGAVATRNSKRRKKNPHKKAGAPEAASPSLQRTPPPSHPDVQSLMAGWSSWEPTEGPPTRDAEGTYHFASHPSFTPNKSPEAVIREGSFGGSYWRPLYSAKLGVTIAEDWRELPASWTSSSPLSPSPGLSIARYLTSATYRPEVNKYGVACGQSIEAWEAAGWIAHAHDVRGWFQWYCRFWMGRRCADDDRQIGRWRRCVGEPGGRWRRALLKKYVQSGIRTVADEEGDGDGGDVDVSPVVHQTCHHWAWEVRQEALDRFWQDGR
ncbi:hypothetical protein SLS62_006268 [Diatrype stigma]|uniref:Uncharacterized protein n=1 Tax=Diatrype stigma TaxID=117547 RepID=A0AAN9URP5_9PEZI